MTDYSKMLLPELKTEAKARGVKGFSTMKKADLLEALKLADAPKSDTKDAPLSFVDGIKAAIRNAREERSNKGRRAGQESKMTAKMMPDAKAENYRLQRGSMTAKLTGKQSRRVRKAERVQGSFAGGADSTNFTYV